MSEPNGYLIHGTAFSSKEAAFKALVSNHEQESWFQKIWDEDAQPYYFESQPQLTIRKSIADKLDKFIEIDFDDVGHEDWWIQENGLIEWFSKTPNCYIKDAYLAGKALGVDLVKVGEG
ncbi:hypothetical protein QYM42_02440 [Lactococcus lactis]|uniref:hypothetical protein n=1 Tax=Lactococcus lactis TaxID=1358 RepID=UPI00265A6661|nr:hypothetical protein [Lactococcus lactis]WKF73644.1 hypothetical protein QYM42_02440 [Lactococcus lactis]